MVVGKNFDTSKWEVLGCFCEHLGIPITATTAPALQGYVDNLTRDSRVHAVGGLDSLQLSSGTLVFPLLNNQVLVITTPTANGLQVSAGAQVISNDGGSFVAAGKADAITVTGLTGGDQDCRALLANAQQPCTSTLPAR